PAFAGTGMKEKKNIDNIFKEGFKNFEATPSPRVWENIQAQLQKEKEDRKLIPLWIKLGGVAALIAVLFSVGNWVYNPSVIENPSITDENVIKTEKETNGNNSEIINELNSNESQVASEENTLQKESSQDLNVLNRNSSEEKNQIPNSSEKSNNTVIASSNSDKKNSKSKEKPKMDLIEKNSQESDLNDGMAISKNATEKINSDKKSEDSNGNIIKDKDIFDDQKEGFAVNENSEKNNSEKIDSEKNLVKTEAEVAEDSKNKKSIFDAIAENNEEEIVAEKTKKEKPEHRWNVAPNVAPVYYSSLENGSSIDPSFADNPQKGDVNMSYGVQVSYALNNRLSVRTGVNNVDLS